MGRVHSLSLQPALATRTHCPYCAFQCGMVMTARARRASQPLSVTVAADPDFPVNRGQMCIKGFHAAALLDHSERLLTPLVRGADGILRKASWEAALSRVAECLLAIKARHGAEATGAFGSGALTNEKAYVLGKFVRLALGSSQIDYNGRYCMASVAAGQNRAYGIDRGLPFPVSDIGETKALMLWGSNCAETMPPIMQWVQRQRDRGGSLSVVDPRRTETARAAQLHLPSRPAAIWPWATRCSRSPYGRARFLLCGLASGGSCKAERMVCNCHKVSETAIEDAVAEGADSAQLVTQRTRAGSGCGSCKTEVARLVQLHAKQRLAQSA